MVASIHALCGCLYVLSLLAGYRPIPDSHYRKLVTLGRDGVVQLVILTAANVHLMPELLDYVQKLCFTPHGSNEKIHFCCKSSFDRPRAGNASVVDLVVNYEVYDRFLPNPMPSGWQAPNGLLVGFTPYNTAMTLVDGRERLASSRWADIHIMKCNMSHKSLCIHVCINIHGKRRWPLARHLGVTFVVRDLQLSH